MITKDVKNIDISFKKAFKKAVIYHFLFIILLFLNGAFSLDFFDTKNKLTLEEIQSSVKVDVVGMPKYLIKELKELKPDRVQRGDEKAVLEKEIVEVEKNIDGAVDLGNVLTSLSEKKVPVNKKRTPKKGSTLSSRDLKSLVIEGNKLNQGESLIGDSLKQERTIFSDYASRLPSHVRPYWKLPSYLLNKNLNCRVRIYLASSGSLIRAEVYESSGVDEYDQKALRAVKASAPFPVPSHEIHVKLASGELILGFPL